MIRSDQVRIELAEVQETCDMFYWHDDFFNYYYFKRPGRVVIGDNVWSHTCKLMTLPFKTNVFIIECKGGYVIVTCRFTDIICFTPWLRQVSVIAVVIYIAYFYKVNIIKLCHVIAFMQELQVQIPNCHNPKYLKNMNKYEYNTNRNSNNIEIPVLYVHLKQMYQDTEDEEKRRVGCEHMKDGD